MGTSALRVRSPIRGLIAMMRAVAAVTLAGAVSLGSGMPAKASSDFVVSGPEVIKTWTNKPGDQAELVFTIRVDWLPDEMLELCELRPKYQNFEDGSRSRCTQYEPASSFYSDGSWKVREAGDGWQVRLVIRSPMVGFDVCTAQSFRALPTEFRLVLISDDSWDPLSGSHELKYVCDGYAWKVEGFSTVMALVGKYSNRNWLNFRVVDRLHRGTAYRICFDLGDGLTDCRISKLRSTMREAAGWQFRESIVWRPVSQLECKRIQRDYPRYYLTFELLRGTGTFSAMGYPFRLDCRP